MRPPQPQAAGMRDGPPPVPDFSMEGVAYAQVALAPPFVLRAPLGDDWRLYLVRGRRVVFEADDLAQTRLELDPGSVLALSGMLQHRFSSPGSGAATALPWIETALRRDAPGAAPSLVMGRIAKQQLMFLAMFERVVAISSAEHPQVTGRIARALDAVADESDRPEPEAEPIVRKLSEIVALEIGRFRRAAGEANDGSGRQAEADPRILRAICAFHAAPEEKWSLERLAAAAGMSRTAFALRYRDLIGATPARSLRRLRMQIATRQLAEGAAAPRLETTARNVGYGSSAALIRAFTREFGTTPRAMAVSQRQATPRPAPREDAGEAAPTSAELGATGDLSASAGGTAAPPQPSATYLVSR